MKFTILLSILLLLDPFSRLNSAGGHLKGFSHKLIIVLTIEYQESSIYYSLQLLIVGIVANGTVGPCMLVGLMNVNCYKVNKQYSGSQLQGSLPVSSALRFKCHVHLEMMRP